MGAGRKAALSSGTNRKKRIEGLKGEEGTMGNGSVARRDGKGRQIKPGGKEVREGGGDWSRVGREKMGSSWLRSLGILAGVSLGGAVGGCGDVKSRQVGTAGVWVGGD